MRKGGEEERTGGGGGGGEDREKGFDLMGGNGWGLAPRKSGTEAGWRVSECGNIAFFSCDPTARSQLTGVIVAI